MKEKGFLTFIITICFFGCFIYGFASYESDYVNSVKKIDMVIKDSIEISSNIFDNNNNGKLVYTTGEMHNFKNKNIEIDNNTIDNVIRLEKKFQQRRHIEGKKYNWVEYDKVSKYSDGAAFGTFYVTDFQLNNVEDIPLVKSFDEKIDGYKIEKDGKYYDNYHLYPERGDRRFWYEYIPNGQKISLIGVQNSDYTITPLKTDIGEIYFQKNGILTKEQFIKKIKKEKTNEENFFRIFMFVIIFIFGISVSSFFTRSNIFSMAFRIGFIVYMSIFAYCWYSYSPIISLQCIAAIIVMFLLMFINNIRRMNNN